MAQQQPPPPQITLPADKLIISLNKKFANVDTGANNELIYGLKNSIKLEVGDSVSLYKSYLNISGQGSNLISLYEDYDVVIKSGLYIPASIKRNSGLGGGNYDFDNWQEYYQVPDYNLVFLNYEQDSPYKIDLTKARFEPSGHSYLIDGDFNSPMIAVEKTSTFYTPVVNKANFKIKKGTYDVKTLALEITSQLNGQQLANDQNGNIIFNDESTDRGFNKIFNSGNQFTYQKDIGLTRAETGLFESNISFEQNNFSIKPLSVSTTAYVDSTPPVAPEKPGKLLMFITHDRVYEILENVKKYIAGDVSKTALEILEIDSKVSPEKRQYDLLEDLPLRDNVLIPKYISPLYASGVEDDGNYVGGIVGGSPYTVAVVTSDDKNYIVCSTEENGTAEVTMGLEALSSGIGWGAVPFVSNQAAPYNRPWLLPWSFLSQEYVNKNPPVEPSNYVKWNKNTQTRQETFRTYGTRTFSLTFDDDNRFALSNLHEPSRIPKSIPTGSDQTADGATPAAAVGNQASKFRNVKTTQSYPQECSSGNCVLSFDNGLVEATDTYQNILTLQKTHDDTTAEYWLYEWALTMLPHDYFFENDKKASAIWETSIWYRLGFIYTDIGKISNITEKFVTPYNKIEVPMTGFITHNSYGSALQIGMSGLGNSFTLNNKNDVTLETFDEVGILDQVIPSGPTPTFNLANMADYVAASVSIQIPEYIYILATSQFYNASILPDLSGGLNYFLIETDLIPSNYLDENDNQRAIIGFVDKEFSNNDTIFGSTAIDFSIKAQKIVNTIKINILNPDGTVPLDTVLRESSAFILIVQRNSNAIFNYSAIENQILVSEEASQPTNQSTTQ